MRSRSLAAQHDAAVARRLQLLTTELAAVRERGPVPDTRVRPAASWSPQGDTHIRAVPDLEDGSTPVEVADDAVAVDETARAQGSGTVDGSYAGPPRVPTYAGVVVTRRP